MLFDLLDIISRADGYIYSWRDGELYIERIAVPQVPAPGAQNEARISVAA